MSQIRITKVYAGAPGTCDYDKKSIDCMVARDRGLLKHSGWLWNVQEGEAVQVPYKELEAVREACKGLCEFTLEHPKYCNHHVGSDVYPFEGVEWKTERCIVVRQMKPVGLHGCYDGHCDGYESEAAAMRFIGERTERCVVKSKSAQNGLVEINMEVRLKSDNTDFINKIASMNGVTSAALVSYNGEYMG